MKEKIIQFQADLNWVWYLTSEGTIYKKHLCGDGETIKIAEHEDN